VQLLEALAAVLKEARPAPAANGEAAGACAADLAKRGAAALQALLDQLGNHAAPPPS
jgi:hypothetical protein